VLIISKALLSPALIDAARRWPMTKNSNGQRRGGAALKNKLTGAPGWRPLLINNPAADNYSIIACRIIKTSSAHMTTKGGLSPDLRGNRTSSGHPPPKNIRRIIPLLPELLCLLNKQSRRGVVPFLPKMDTTKNKRNRQE